MKVSALPSGEERFCTFCCLAPYHSRTVLFVSVKPDPETVMRSPDLAIDGKTNLSQVSVPFTDLDAILIMTINAGFSRQTFTKEYAEKVKDIQNKKMEHADLEHLSIEVDGGINNQTISLAKEAGATRFVSTSFLFGKSAQEAFQILLRALGGNSSR